MQRLCPKGSDRHTCARMHVCKCCTCMHVLYMYACMYACTYTYECILVEVLYVCVHAYVVGTHSDSTCVRRVSGHVCAHANGYIAHAEMHFACISGYKSVYASLCICLHVFVYKHMHIHACIQRCVYVFLCLSCAYVSSHMHICMDTLFGRNLFIYMCAGLSFLHRIVNRALVFFFVLMV